MNLTDTNRPNLIPVLAKCLICLVCGSVLLCAFGMLVGRFYETPQLAYVGDAFTIRLADLRHKLSLPLITHLEDTPINLNWSPNGRWLGFFLLQQGRYNLLAVNMDNQQVHAVVENAFSSVAPAWSPDGTQIAYTPNGVHLCIQNLPAASPHCHNVQRITQVVWSPDGTTLAYINPLSDESGIYLTDPQMLNTRHLISTPPTITELQWSPDGKFLSYHYGVSTERTRDLYLVNVSSGIQKNLTNGTLGYVSGLTWSPDSSTVAFRGRANDIYTLNLTTNQISPLNHSAVSDNSSPEWSGDGLWLAYVATQVGGTPYIVIWSESGGFEIFAYNFSLDLAWRPHV